MSDDQCKWITDAIHVAALTIATAILASSDRDYECRPAGVMLPHQRRAKEIMAASKAAVQRNET